MTTTPTPPRFPPLWNLLALALFCAIGISILVGALNELATTTP